MAPGADIIIHCQGLGNLLRSLHCSNPTVFDHVLERQRGKIANLLEDTSMTVEQANELTELFADWPIPRDTKEKLIASATDAIDTEQTNR